MSAYELGEGLREVVDLVESTAADRVASEERAEDQLAKLKKIGMTAGNYICDIKNDNKMVLKGIQILTDQVQGLAKMVEELSGQAISAAQRDKRQ